MLKATEGIIISEVNYGEKSKIINVLTKDGILGVMCKGAKSLKSPLRTSTMKFNLSSFLLYYHENGLSTLKECDVICDYKNIKSDILLISYMSYICDLAAGVEMFTYKLVGTHELISMAKYACLAVPCSMEDKACQALDYLKLEYRPLNVLDKFTLILIDKVQTAKLPEIKKFIKFILNNK